MATIPRVARNEARTLARDGVVGLPEIPTRRRFEEKRGFCVGFRLNGSFDTAPGIP